MQGCSTKMHAQEFCGPCCIQNLVKLHSHCLIFLTSCTRIFCPSVVINKFRPFLFKLRAWSLKSKCCIHSLLPTRIENYQNLAYRRQYLSAWPMNLLLGLGSKAKMTLMSFTAIKVLVRNFESGIHVVSNIQGPFPCLIFLCSGNISIKVQIQK